MDVRLISKTEVDKSYLEHLKQIAGDDFTQYIENNAEALIAYIARVSAPKNQTNQSYEKLLAYCIKEAHWSVFEMVDITFEIITSRAIAQQIIRHRSFSFQEFSQRYAQANLGFEFATARRQDLENRQNSIDDMDEETKEWFSIAQEYIYKISMDFYKQALDKNIAKEQARFLLPLSTSTKLYMKGSLRNFIHYVNLRSANGTQKEHSEIALGIKNNLIKVFPIVSKACGWI